MEKKGLSRGIEFLSANSLNINTLITDRHSQISKFVSKSTPVLNIAMTFGMLVNMGTESSFKSYIIYTYILLQE